jgi:hypothetical protein
MECTKVLGARRHHTLSGALLVLAAGAVFLSLFTDWLSVTGPDFTGEVGEQVGWVMTGPTSVGLDVGEHVVLGLAAACLAGLGLLLLVSRSRTSGLLLRGAVLLPLVGVGTFAVVGWDFVLHPARVLEVQPDQVRDAVLPLLHHGLHTLDSWRISAGPALWLQSAGLVLAAVGVLVPWRLERSPQTRRVEVIAVRPAVQPPVGPVPRPGRP